VLLLDIKLIIYIINLDLVKILLKEI